MEAQEHTLEAKTILNLAETAISVRGPVGALLWAAEVSICETNEFNSFVKAAQETGDKMDMTPEAISAYNHMVYGVALLQAVKGMVEQAGAGSSNLGAQTLN